MSSGLKRPSVIQGLQSAVDSGKAAPLPVPAKPAKPIRLNLDIDRELHRWLKGFALQADSDVAHVVRALLADKVRARLRQ